LFGWIITNNLKDYHPKNGRHWIDNEIQNNFRRWTIHIPISYRSAGLQYCDRLHPLKFFNRDWFLPYSTRKGERVKVLLRNRSYLGASDLLPNYTGIFYLPHYFALQAALIPFVVCNHHQTLAWFLTCGWARLRTMWCTHAIYMRVATLGAKKKLYYLLSPQLLYLLFSWKSADKITWGEATLIQPTQSMKWQVPCID